MRILSQDGLHEGIIDVPYEQVSIEQKKNEIWCGYYPTLSQHCVARRFGKYSTEAKAKRAMEMLREAYTGKIDGYKTEEGVLYREKANYECRYFQFPADEEMED